MTKPLLIAAGCGFAKVLNETFALEESKRLELEFQEKERREAEKQMHRDHEATKVKQLPAHIPLCATMLYSRRAASWGSPRPLLALIYWFWCRRRVAKGPNCGLLPCT